MSLVVTVQETQEKTITSKPVHYNSFLFMKRIRSSLYTSSIGLSQNVQCLLESGQTSETVRRAVEASLVLFCTRDMGPHGNFIYLF